jgi:hypothetical protein
MTTFEIDSNDRGDFTCRQFQPPTTNAQLVCDVLFGVMAPILCFVFDPAILRTSGFLSPFAPNEAFFPQFAAFVYIASGIEIMLLTAWLIWGRRMQTATQLAGGILMAGALFSGLIGLILLPLSVTGLTIGIGVFGFVPFLTALVYLRNARSAFQFTAKPLAVPGAPESKPNDALELRVRRSTLLATVAGGVLVLGPPAALNAAASVFVSEAMDAVLTADEQQSDLAIDEIRYLQFFARPQVDRLVSAYSTTDEPSRKEVLKRRYLKLTGDDIEQKMAIIRD